MSVGSDCVHMVGLCTLVDATGEHQTRWDKASEDMIHKSTVETDDRQMQGRSYARRRLPSSLRGSVNDIAASEDILERLSCIKPFRENIIVYYIMSALYFILFILKRCKSGRPCFRGPGLV